MSGSAEALVYIEDPGAVGYLRELPQALEARGATVMTLAGGRAIELLHGAVAYPGGDAGAVLRTMQPSVLVVGTAEDPASPGLDLIDVARSLRIPSIGAVDGPMNPDNRFRGRSAQPLAHAPDLILVPDEATRQRFVQLGRQSSSVIACGHPLYDAVGRERDRLDALGRSALRTSIFGDAAGRLAFVFASEISSGPDPDQYRRSAEYTLQGRGTSDGRTEIVIEEFLEAVADLRPRPYLILRLHPKNVATDLAAYVRAFDLVSEGPGVHELLFCADAVVGMTSSVLAEAAILGTPTLAIVPRPVETQWLPTIAAGVTPCATTRAEVRAEIARLPSRSAAARVAWTPPSDALDRVADVVIRSYARSRA